MTDPFVSPSASSNPDAKNLKDFNGALVLVTPKEYQTGIATKYGEKDALLVDFVVIDGPSAGTESEGSLEFGARVIGALKGLIGNSVLGRVGQESTGKGNPAWVISPPTEADKAAARKFLGV